MKQIFSLPLSFYRWLCRRVDYIVLFPELAENIRQYYPDPQGRRDAMSDAVFSHMKLDAAWYKKFSKNDLAYKAALIAVEAFPEE